jgi:hypothetical protein
MKYTTYAANDVMIEVKHNYLISGGSWAYLFLLDKNTLVILHEIRNRNIMDMHSL